MSNRWLRFGVALLALAAAGVAGFRIYQQEQQLANSIATAGSTDHSAEAALHSVPEVKAALHAYVAEGQGHAFWTARAAMLLERLRTSLLELDGPAAAAGISLTDVLDLADRLAASERRAREHVRAEQKLLAGEVIFTEARDTLDAMRLQLARVRTQFGENALKAQDEIRRGQKLLAAGGFAILAFALVLLTLPAASTATVAVPKTPAAGPADEFESSARLVSRTAIKQTTAPPAKAVARSNGGAPSAASSTGGSSAPTPSAADRVPGKATTVARSTTASGVGPGSNGSGASTTSAQPAAAPPAAPAATPAASAPSLREAAAICTELGRASQSIEVSNLLARAAKVLDASGAVVWMASLDGRELYPAASAGYDERLLARIGNIPRTANNVTAGAIRSGTPRSSARSGQSAAALAVPLLTPLGAVGVLSAELKNVADVDETRMAVATIFAAQLASLVGQRSAGAVAATAPTTQAK